MSNRKKATKSSRTQELQKKYPGHKPIPPSTRTVVITLIATIVLSLLIVFVFFRKTPVAPQPLGKRTVMLETSMGTIKLELDGDKAPRTVAQFLANVTGGKYDGLTFHRVLKGFMIQGGDPNGNGTGGNEIPFENTGISHVRGVISMASSQAGVTQSDMQFFIMQGDATSLDSKYASFGKVIDGMDVVDKIANVPVGENPSVPGEMSSPLSRITIIRATEVAN